MPRPTPSLAYATVNDFFRDPHFKALRPRYHVIADPVYWYDDCLEAYGAPVVEALASADWDCTLFLPRRASGSRLHSELVKRGVEYVFCPVAPLEGFTAFRRLMFRLRLAAPRAQNVLVATVAIALWMEVRDIYIFGADHSWHREITVADDNVVVHAGAHSYDLKEERKPFWKPEGLRKVLNGLPTERADCFTISELFLAWSRVHRSYEMLADLANARGARVRNATQDSFIDAFERASPSVITDNA